MTLQVLVSCMNKDMDDLVSSMRLASDAIIVNQCDHYDYSEKNYDGNKVQFFSMKERGVGLSRNTALQRSEADIILFSDEDIVYDDGYVSKVLEAFEARPGADMLIFNMRVCEERFTYHTSKEKRIHSYNAGRYPTYSFAIRREKLIKTGVTYSLLFGGGAKYSAGEDSLFLMNCIKKGLRVYALPIEIGEEKARPSTWFQGYTEKFFYDRGVLYHHLYGWLAPVFAARFIMAKKSFMCQEVPAGKAYKLIKKGIKDAK